MSATTDFETTARKLANLAGWLAVAAMLALASLGVRVVGAEDLADNVLSAPLDGPSCQADPARDPAADLAHVIEHARRQAMAEGVSNGVPAGDDAVVMLNNRGYNYGQAPGPDPVLETR